MAGNFIWRELLTTDVDAAKQFYTKVVGWQMENVQAGNTPYTILNAGGTGVGGLMAIPQEMCDAGGRPGWMGYVHVDDVDAAANAVVAKGGKVHKQPQDIPGYGRFAVVADPHGAIFNVMAPIGEDGLPPPLGTPGTAAWHELYAGDMEADFAFYAAMFGWKKCDAVDMGAMGVYQLFATTSGGQAVGGMMTKMPDMPHPFWNYYFYTDDVRAGVTRLEENGGRVINGPMEVPGGDWIIQALDPQGALFGLVEPGKK